MLDIKYIRENPDKVKQGAEAKQVKVDIDRLLEVDQQRRELLQQIEKLKAEQNQISGQGGKLSDDDQKKAKDLKKQIKEIEPGLEEIEKEFNQLMRQVPNLPLADVCLGKSEEDNQIARTEGKKTEFDFQPKDYLSLAENLDMIDIQRAAKVAGTRFGYLKGGAALMEMALVQLAFNKLIQKGFIPVIPPVMLNQQAMSGMGYLDRGADEVYHLEKDDLYLIGTSEQSIGAMHMNEIFKEKDLPKRYLGFSTCFRREAGAYGKDTKGILRVHQFDKVEMFSFCHPDKAEQEHDLLLSLEEKLMQALKIPYQVIDICSADLGDPAAKKWDIEAWMPGQNEYRETHSTSNCTDYQARRLNTRYKAKDGKLNYVYTLNGTALAIGRMLIAIIENYQQADGSVKVPQALQPYMNNLKEIKKD